VKKHLIFLVKISIVLITRVSIDMTLYVVICNSDCYMTEQFWVRSRFGRPGNPASCRSEECLLL